MSFAARLRSCECKIVLLRDAWRKNSSSVKKTRREAHNTEYELISYNNYNLSGLFEYNNTSKAFNILTSWIKYCSANKMISPKSSSSEMHDSSWLHQKGEGHLHCTASWRDMLVMPTTFAEMQVRMKPLSSRLTLTRVRLMEWMFDE